MKTVCAVLCALLYVCRAAPLTCDQLTSAGQVQDLTGTWFVHAMNTDSCVLRSTLKTLLSPSVKMDITKDTQQYQTTLTYKTLSYCEKDTVISLTPLNGLLTSDNGEDTYKSLHSSCSDCLVFRVDFSNNTMLFFSSRRTSVEPVEILEFEKQASCLHLPRPERLGSDFDFTNCRDSDAEPTEAEMALIQERITVWAQELFKCWVDYVSSWFKST